MHDREFTKPEPLKVRHPQAPAGAPLLDYSFEQYLGEFVWSYAKWNAEEDWGEAQIRLGEAVEAAQAGDLVKIGTLDDWEKLREANRAATITGPLAPKIRQMQKAIKGARRPASEATEK